MTEQPTEATTLDPATDLGVLLAQYDHLLSKYAQCVLELPPDSGAALHSLEIVAAVNRTAGLRARWGLPWPTPRPT